MLVEGSSRIHMISKIIKDFFNGKESYIDFNPNEAVCFGASIIRGFIYDKEQRNGFVYEINPTPISLGIETSGGIMTKIIPKGSYIPTKKSQVCTTGQDSQQSVNIPIFKGERLLAKYNYYLGQINFSEISLEARGLLQIEDTFEIDSNGILKVSAIDKGTGSRKEIVIVSVSERRSKVDIEKLQKEALNKIILIMKEMLLRTPQNHAYYQ